jgi:hypothetical protein
MADGHVFVLSLACAQVAVTLAVTLGRWLEQVPSPSRTIARTLTPPCRPVQNARHALRKSTGGAPPQPAALGKSPSLAELIDADDAADVENLPDEEDDVGRCPRARACHSRCAVYHGRSDGWIHRRTSPFRTVAGPCALGYGALLPGGALESDGTWEKPTRGHSLH